ncbi:hypothetical protein [Paenibacillus tianmuensis]|uniref:hypothetical protein n=1 Tax=Paenibacillus tianmuensis TaxID=624147 RepID=UPI001C27064E|nr:hypothetical protein [Paenibacillus tianmuensis]
MTKTLLSLNLETTNGKTKPLIAWEQNRIKGTMTVDSKELVFPNTKEITVIK